MQTIPVGTRFDPTEAQWAALGPLLPVGHRFIRGGG